jgi:hypothetical protein
MDGVLDDSRRWGFGNLPRPLENIWFPESGGKSSHKRPI